MKLVDARMELDAAKLVMKFERLRNDNVYKDVTVTAHDVIIMAHKCILSAGSPFFNLLFQQAERKTDLFHRSSFKLVGLARDEVKQLDAVVDFLYSGVIYMNDVNFMATMKLADYLAVDELLDLGERYVEYNITKETCLKLYLDMKKSLTGDVSKRSGVLGKRTHDLLRLIWGAVEKNFYDHVIEHHEFLEVIPEEVERLLTENFRLEKVLQLAVRWMKTWPLGFTFADSLVNISYDKLHTAKQQDLSEQCKTYIVDATRTIREQVLSRTVPKSNKANIVRKLKEIQKSFDENYVESEEEETEGKMEVDGELYGKIKVGEKDADIMETDAGNTKFTNMRKVPPNGTEDGVENMEDETDIENRVKHSVVGPTEESEAVKCTEHSGYVAINNKSDVQGHTEKTEVKSKFDGNGQFGSGDYRTGSQNQTSNKTCNEAGSDLNVQTKSDKPNGDIGIGENVDCKEETPESFGENGMPASSKSNILEGPTAALQRNTDTSNADLLKKPGIDNDNKTVGVGVNQKSDGTGEEATEYHSDLENDIDTSETESLTNDELIPVREYGSQSSDFDRSTKSLKMFPIDDGACGSEYSLEDRVAECLRQQQVVKTEVDDDDTDTVEMKRRGKRRRGRPKKYINYDVEEPLKVKIMMVKGKIGVMKRKATDMDDSGVDGTMIKVEVGGEDDGKIYEMKDDSGNEGEGDGYKEIEQEDWDGDTDDDFSENVFHQLLKQSAGSDGNGAAMNKRLRKRSPRKPGHHECDVCHKIYTQKYRLAQHMNMHLGIKPYKCVVCLQCFTRTDHVVRHMRSQHLDMDIYKCDQCDEEFEKANEVVSHSMIHIQQADDIEQKIVTVLTDVEKEYISVTAQDSGRPQYSCTKCNQTFKKPYQAREHVNFHTGEKPYKCGQCVMAFGKKENLTAHIRSIHDGKRGEHRCAKCRRFFMKKENYETHIEKCVPHYQCSKCPMKFYRKTHLDNHTPVHDATPQHQCTQCSNAYRYRKHMLRHVRKDHLMEEDKQAPCICDTCGVVVKNKEALYRHKKTHKLPDKECDVCGKAFKDNTTLKDHKLMHTNIRDYQCEICSMLFARKGNLVRHQKRHRGERKYRCEICGMCFVANCDLTRHKNTHLGVKKFPCRYCGRKFGLKSKVVVHERTHTGERPYFCREEKCGKTFKQTGDRVRHEKKVHNLTFNKYMTLYELATGESEDIFKHEEGATPSKDGQFIPPISSDTEQTAGTSSTSSLTIAAALGTNIGAMEYNQNPEVDRNFIEETEMSKIFQRTVAAISQEAIANSGIYN